MLKACQRTFLFRIRILPLLYISYAIRENFLFLFSFLPCIFITFSICALHWQPDFVSTLTWNALKSVCLQLCSQLNISQSCSFNWYKYWGQIFSSTLIPNTTQLITDYVGSETTFWSFALRFLGFFHNFFLYFLTRSQIKRLRQYL